MVFEVVFPTVPVRVAQLQIIWIQEVRTMHFVLVELYNRKRGGKKSRVREKETGENLLVTWLKTWAFPIDFFFFFFFN